MSGKYRWGIMGPGGISVTILRDFRLAGIQVVAVGSRSLERAENYAQAHDIRIGYGSYEELVADSELDVIYIATTQNAHFENARLAIESGKHVLLEKPFTLDANQAAELVKLARARGVFLMEAMWTRFLPNHVRLFELLSRGIIGQPLYLIADHNQFLPVEVAPRLHAPELGGGALIDLGVYPISLAHRIFGKPQRIQATASLMPGEIDEAVGTVFDYEGGRMALTHSSLRVNGPVSASILGTEGRIELAKSFYSHGPFTVFNQQDQVIESYEGTIVGRGMQYQALEVERCLNEGLTESPIMPLDETIEIMQVMDEIRSLTGIRYTGV